MKFSCYSPLPISYQTRKLAAGSTGEASGTILWATYFTTLFSLLLNENLSLPLFCSNFFLYGSTALWTLATLSVSSAYSQWVGLLPRTGD
jgi:hypothetical protein